MRTKTLAEQFLHYLKEQISSSIDENEECFDERKALREIRRRINKITDHVIQGVDCVVK